MLNFSSFFYKPHSGAVLLGLAQSAAKSNQIANTPTSGKLEIPFQHDAFEDLGGSQRKGKFQNFIRVVGTVGHGLHHGLVYTSLALQVYKMDAVPMSADELQCSDGLRAIFIRKEEMIQLLRMSPTVCVSEFFIHIIPKIKP